MDFNWPVVGHKKIVSYLQTVIENDQVNHAYLFYGKNSLGKSLVAKYFIQSIFCLSDKSKPCGTCSHCNQLKRGVHPDVIYLKREDDKKNISIEQVRRVRDKLQHGSFLDSYKVVVIEDAESLSLSASNAMLKILEEPVGKTVYVFLCENLNTIPETVISRVMSVEFLAVNKKEIAEYLVTLGKSKEEAYELSCMSLGLPGLAINLSTSKKALASESQGRQEILNGIFGDINDRFAVVEGLAGQDKSEKARLKSIDFLYNLSIIVRDVMLLKNMCFDRVVNTPMRDNLLEKASQYDNLKLVSILEKIKKTEEYIKRNVNLRLALENLMLEF